MNFRVIVATILTALMLLLGQQYTYADGITEPVTTNVYIFRHGRLDYPVLKSSSEAEIRNSAEKISCDSGTSPKYTIFYLVNHNPKNNPEKNSIRFKQTADQIDAGLKESCNSNIDLEVIHVWDSSGLRYYDSQKLWNDDLQKVWHEITDDSVNYYNKIFVLSAEVIKGLLKPAQCPIDASCFMEEWQDVRQAVEESKDEYNNIYQPEKDKEDTDFLYTMILHLQLPRTTKPYNSISPVDVEKITICSKP